MTRDRSRPGLLAGHRMPLAAAIVSEVTATLALRAAVDQPAWYALTAVGYLAAFGLLARTLEAGMPVGVAYAVWAATGVAATAVLAATLFGEALTPLVGAGIALIVAITEGIPAHDELRVYNHLARNPGVRLVGPNCPGILSPGKANVGIIPAAFFREGNVGVVSRSGTLTYQIGNELKQAGLGNSSIVGIGGDPIVGSDFIDILELYENDDETELIVLVGEICAERLAR